MKAKMTNFDREMLVKNVKSYLYWQMEADQNMREGQYFSMHAVSVMLGYLHDIAMTCAQVDVEGEWDSIYQEASERARKEFMESQNNVKEARKGMK